MAKAVVVTTGELTPEFIRHIAKLVAAFRALPPLEPDDYIILSTVGRAAR